MICQDILGIKPAAEEILRTEFTETVPYTAEDLDDTGKLQAALKHACTLCIKKHSLQQHHTILQKMSMG